MTPSQPPRKSPPSRRPLWLLLLNIACVAAAELFLSVGSKSAPAGGPLDFSALASTCTLVGILFHISAFICWMLALRTVPLALAYNFAAANQVVIPIASLLLLHEHISGLKWIGILLVLAGFVLLVPLIVRTEQEFEPPAPPVSSQKCNPDKSGTALP